MKKLLAFFSVLFLVAGMVSAQIPDKIEVNAENWVSWYQGDFKNALYYTGLGVDTIVLGTGGFVYTTKDTTPYVIEFPVVIMAKEGLTEKPIFTHPNTGFVSGAPSAAMEIFRICNTIEFHGIAFRGDIPETQGCKYALRYGDWTVPGTGRTILGKTGTRMTFKNCDFIGFHELKDQAKQGNVLYFLRPNDVSKDHLKNTKVFFENCLFKDIGDEAIRISENEKYPNNLSVIACDTLIVRNCTFDDIDAECIRIYGDLDTSNTDGYLLADHVTVVHSSPRFIYGKNFRNAHIRNLVAAFGREPGITRPDRGDYLIQVQLRGSTVAYIDSFSLVFPLSYDPRIGATKGGYVDNTTIYGYDPKFVDAANGDYTLASNSPLYWLSSDGTALGDLRWATNTPTVAPLKINIVGSGEVTSDPAGDGVYTLGTEVTLTAVPASGWKFAGWSGDLTGTTNPATVTINTAKTVTATFELETGIRNGSLPREYHLAQNHPNPFNPTTKIAFTLKQAGATKLTIFNLLGQPVRTIIDRQLNAGEYSIVFDATDLPTGVYIYELTSGSFQAIKKMLLIK